MARKIEVQLIGDAASLKRAFREGETSANRFGKALKFTGATVGITGIAAALTKAASATVTFDRSMRNVNSIAGLNEKKFKSLSKAVLALAGKTAQAPDTLAKGLYDLVSSGFNAHQSMLILASSAKAATAGLTTTEISTKAVASVLNAYHLPAQQAAKVSDTLFQTVNRGVISFEQLSTTLGDVLPFASSLGVSLGQVGAAVSTMTKEGIGPEETMTRIKNVMVAMLKPGKDLSAAIKTTGASSGEALVKQKGYQGALEAVLHTTDGTKSAVAKLFPNIRALGGVLALTGKNARTAHGDLNGFKNVTGATDKALKEQQKSISYGWQHIKAQVTAASIEVGSVLVPAFSKGLGAISGFISTTAGKFNDLKSKGAGTFPAIGKMIADAFKSIDWKGVGATMGAGLSKALDLSKKLTPAMEAGIAAAVSHINGAKALSGILKVTSQALSALLSPAFWYKNFWAIFNVVTFVFPVGKIFKIPGATYLAEHISEPIFRAVKIVGKGTVELLGKTGSSAVRGFVDELSKLAPGAARAGGSMVRKFGSAIGSLPGHAREMAGRVVTYISGTITNGAGAVGSAVGRVVAAILRPLGQAAGKVLAPVGKIGAAIVGQIRQFVGAVFRVGLDVTAGLAHGIASGAGAVYEAFKSIAKQGVNLLTHPWKILSPSKKFWEIGNFVSLGLALGIESGASRIRAAAQTGLLFPIEGAIAKLNAQKDALQATFDKLDKQRERQGLVAALKGAGTSSGAGSSASGGGLSFSGDPTAWARSMVGHFVETGHNTGQELDKLEKQFGTRAAAWCAMFASTSAAMGGASKAIKSASVATLRDWAKAGTHGFQKGFQRSPRAGDLMAFGTAHIGVVESVDRRAGVVHTVEGNTSAGKVARKSHAIDSGTYLRPIYGGGSGSRGGSGSVKLTGKLSPQQIRGVAYGAGFRGKALDLAVAIAMAESGGNTGSTNHNTNGTVDRGLFQINSVHGGMSTYSTTANAKAAFSLYKKRGGFADWVTFNTGAYKKFMGNTGSGRGANVGAGSASGRVKGGDGGSISDAIKALKDFDLQASRARKLAAIDLKIKGLEKLQAFKGAVADIRTQITDKLNTAVQAFSDKWEATIGKTVDAANTRALDGFDKQTEVMVTNGDLAQQLAKMKADDLAAQQASEDAANQKALDDAQKAGDAQAVLDAQAAIVATQRGRDEVALEARVQDEEAAIRAQRAQDRKALEDQQAADRQALRDADVAAFTKAEQAKLDALVTSLEAQKTTYANFARAVSAILGPLAPGLGFDASADQEATINGGSGAVKVTLPKSWVGVNHSAWGGHRAVGGPVRAGFPYVVNESRAEVFVPDHNGRIVPNPTGMGGGGKLVGIENHGNLTIGSNKGAEVMANNLAWRLRNS